VILRLIDCDDCGQSFTSSTYFNHKCSKVLAKKRAKRRMERRARKAQQAAVKAQQDAIPGLILAELREMNRLLAQLAKSRR
jgi:hypothetical protein